MNDKWYVSKRFYAAAILIVATIAAGFGVEIDSEAQKVIVSNLTAIGVAAAALVSALLDLWSKHNEAKKGE